MLPPQRSHRSLIQNTTERTMTVFQVVFGCADEQISRTGRDRTSTLGNRQGRFRTVKDSSYGGRGCWNNVPNIQRTRRGVRRVARALGTNCTRAIRLPATFFSCSLLWTFFWLMNKEGVIFYIWQETKSAWAARKFWKIIWISCNSGDLMGLLMCKKARGLSPSLIAPDYDKMLTWPPCFLRKTELTFFKIKFLQFVVQWISSLTLASQYYISDGRKTEL